MNQTTLVEAVLAWAEDGRFKEGRAPRPDRLGRLPQLADRIAYARQRIANGGMNAPGLREQSGIQLP